MHRSAGPHLATIAVSSQRSWCVKIARGWISLLQYSLIGADSVEFGMPAVEATTSLVPRVAQPVNSMVTPITAKDSRKDIGQ